MSSLGSTITYTVYVLHDNNFTRKYITDTINMQTLHIKEFLKQKSESSNLSWIYDYANCFTNTFYRCFPQPVAVFVRTSNHRALSSLLSQALDFYPADPLPTPHPDLQNVREMTKRCYIHETRYGEKSLSR